MIRYVRPCAMRGFDMGISIRRLSLVCAVLGYGLVLTACTSTVRDTRYISAEQGPPLQVPAGMDTPNYNPEMKVPAVVGLDRNKIDTSFAPIRPPHLEDTE